MSSIDILFSKKRNLSLKEKINWLRLARTENIGPKTFISLLMLCGSVENAIEKAPQLSIRGGKKSPVVVCPEDVVLAEMEETERIGGKIITFIEPEYPSYLLNTEDFPPVISILGRQELLNKLSISIVGTRNASINGYKLAEQFAKELGEHGFVVTSGMARGIDTAAHKAALEKGTIAVLGGGLDNIYPPENKNLYHEIAEKGLLIAESPIKTIPKPQSFPRRNRIISGLSLGVAVIEANLNSGSLITAKIANNQGREIFAVPGFPKDPRAKGTNYLIKQGANILEDVNDILQIVNPIIDNKILEKKDFYFDNRNIMLEEINEEEIEEIRPRIINLIGGGPVKIEDLINFTGYPASIILALLVELELAGRIIRQSGNKVILTNMISDVEIL